jgi:PKD repeat protein
MHIERSTKHFANMVTKCHLYRTPLILPYHIKRYFAVLTVLLTCLAVQAVFTLPVYGDEIVGWGRNDDGQATPPEGTDFIAVDGGSWHGLALKSDGSIVCWGDYNYWGQATPPTGSDFIAISAGWLHNLALKSDGSIFCWGGDNYGQTMPQGGTDFIAIAGGGWHSLALKADGSIVGWGRNLDGQATPPSGTGFIAISAGAHHSLALKYDGSIVGWGHNSFGQATPPAGNDFIAIAAGGLHSLALKSDGSIVGWGLNNLGQATPPEENNNFTAIAAGDAHSLALKSDGSIVGWGHNYNGQATPPPGNNFTAVAAGQLHSLALLTLLQNSPPVADAGGPYAGDEGSDVTFNGTGSYDPDGDPLTYVWDFGDGNTGAGPTAVHTYADNGVYDVSLTVTDPDGASSTQGTTATIANVAPTVGPIAAPGDPVQLGTGDICATADFVDMSEADTHTAEWDWGDGVVESGTVDETLGYGSVDDCHAYTEAGIYTIILTVTDDDGDSGQAEFQYVVVYDPSGGFVTGGGWIWSPSGAYEDDPLLEGKANFGFVSKYKKGATIPTGNTEFVFQAGDLNFHSSSYEWLVVTGSNYARFKGAGTINCSGDYKFMLWAGDNEPDTFRIRIWEEDEISGEETVIYDNGNDQAIEGGSIIVHVK